MTDMLDVWTHILPPAYFAKLQTLASTAGPLKRWMTLRSLYDLDERFRLMDRFEGYRQVLTPSMPAFESLGTPEEAAGFASLMNDELARLVTTYPDRFPYFVGGLSLLDEEHALGEIKRAVAMGARGFQLPTHVNGLPLDEQRFAGIIDAIASLGLAIWLHPIKGPAPDYPSETKSKYEIWWCFGWPYESSVAMARLVFSGTFDRYPTLRIVTHHMGAMIPFFAGRIEQGWGLEMGSRTPADDSHLLPVSLKRSPSEYFRMFYADTALSGFAPALRCGLDYFGNDRVVFSTDFPFDVEGGSYLVRETIRSIKELDLGHEVARRIFRSNGEALLQPTV